jgi:hypothetical protein
VATWTEFRGAEVSGKSLRKEFTAEVMRAQRKPEKNRKDARNARKNYAKTPIRGVIQAVYSWFTIGDRIQFCTL